MRTLEREPDLHVLAVKVVDGSVSTDGYLLVRRDTPAKSVAELKGHGLCLSDPLSSTGYLLPRAFLADAGLDPDRDFVVRLSGNHQQVLVDLLDGKCDLGATYSGNFNTADQRGVATARLRILGMTGSAPHDAFVAAADADEALVGAFRDALLAFDPARDAGTARVGESELITGFAAPTPEYLRPPLGSR
jgi:ABC-type phosphate/phosphonate transport system substrate-binding protein